MPSPEEVLQVLYVAGFEFHTFERYPNAVGVSRGGAMILLTPTPTGLRPLGTPGWKMGELIGVLTTKDGRKVFQHKSEIIEATPEKLAIVEDFKYDLDRILAGKPS
ncbi:MAG: hypothetical protein JWO13_791 [Acidobacteriales bacterium]|nr:hypothetical protein [Terriglobales bacterium]